MKPLFNVYWTANHRSTRFTNLILKRCLKQTCCRPGHVLGHHGYMTPTKTNTEQEKRGQSATNTKQFLSVLYV